MMQAAEAEQLKLFVLRSWLLFFLGIVTEHQREGTGGKNEDRRKQVRRNLFLHLFSSVFVFSAFVSSS